MSNLSLRNIYKVYDGDVRAVNDFNLEIKDKEFIVFVGPSGCGKSTTLRMVAGLEEITSGDLIMDNIRMNDVEPKDRNIAMVFQSYALYPHMSVFDNMAFGLKIRKVPQDEIKERVEKAAEILGISNLLNRKPKALSGGQRQRVALGRAIVREPNVFLLDEPLSNLDAKLRVQMRTEITKLHKRLETTFIYVTHDQTEAMTMGDRIVVMKDGYIQQVDTPATLYEEPANMFVATFLGSPQMNTFDVSLTKEDDNLFVEFGSNKVSLNEKGKELSDFSQIGKNVKFGIRPENIKLVKDGIKATVDAVEHLGSETIIYSMVKGIDSTVIVKIPTDHSIVPQSEINIEFDMDKCHMFDLETTKSILGVPHDIVLNAKFKDDKVIVNSKEEIELGDSLKQYLFDFSKESLDRILIPTEFISLDKDDDKLEIKGSVEFVKKCTDDYQVYLKTSLKDGYFAFRSKNMFEPNKKISVYVPFNKIVLVDKNGLRLNSRIVIKENKTLVNVINDGTKTKILFGNNILVYPTLGVENGKYEMTIDSSKVGFEYKKSYARKNKIKYEQKENTISVSAYDEDLLGSKNAVFVKASGFDDYLTFVIDNKFSVYSMTDFKISIPQEAIKLKRM